MDLFESWRMKNKLAVNKFWGKNMTDTKTTITETDKKEDQNEPSDARIILGPLVKYAAVGLVLVGIIITTAVMLDRQYNDIDREVAELEAQLAQARMDTVAVADTDSAAASQAEVTSTVEAEAVQQKPAVVEVTEAEKPAATPVVENSVDTTPAVTQLAAQAVKTEVIVTESTVAEDTVVEDAVANKTNRHDDFFDQSFDELIAERNTYLKEKDRVYLEEFKASQERQLQFMRERLARQEQKIKEMEQRNQEIYDYRAANVKEMQQMRETFMPDRI